MAKYNQKSFAKKYGFALSYLQSDPELYGLFQAAVKKNQDPKDFLNAVRNSKWYKKHGDTYRSMLGMEKSDPGTFAEKLNAKLADLQDTAKGLGASLNGDALRDLAHSALLGGWTDAQVSNALAAYIKVTHGSALGSSGDAVQALQQTAWKNGVHVSDAWLQNYARAIANGNATLQDGQRTLREHYGVGLAPGFEKQLKSGMDLYDVASPYMQSMATLLEKNPAQIDLFDPKIRQALSHKGADGKVASMTLPEFEQSIRSSPDWLKTNNARDSVSAAAHKVLQDFGLMGA